MTNLISLKKPLIQKEARNPNVDEQCYKLRFFFVYETETDICLNILALTIKRLP